MSRHDRNAEFADWIRAIGRWKSRQRNLKNLLVGIEDLLREREEVMEEALWLRATADSAEDYDEADDALSLALASAQDEHEATVQKLAEIFTTLKDSQPEEFFERPSMVTSKISSDPVEEASRESFPASDPPSFNPGSA